VKEPPLYFPRRSTDVGTFPERVRVRIYDDRLELYYAGQPGGEK
jgi:hypothetical protein